MNGIVQAFDEPRGLGTIESDGAEYPFHCTALLDGTRTIQVGTTGAPSGAPATTRTSASAPPSPRLMTWP